MASLETKEWFLRAEMDFEEAEFLLRNSRPLEHVALFLHQAAEKYLKGFLISKGWKLERTHDLVKLLRDVARFDESLEDFIPLMQEMADYYIESRYPVGYLVEYTKREIEKTMNGSRVFIALIRDKVRWALGD